MSTLSKKRAALQECRKAFPSANFVPGRVYEKTDKNFDIVFVMKGDEYSIYYDAEQNKFWYLSSGQYFDTVTECCESLFLYYEEYSAMQSAKAKKRSENFRSLLDSMKR